MTNNTYNKHDGLIDEPSTTKYLIRAEFTIDGLVEKPDVVGALFGQTEGLLSEELELRELQRSGRVGRIQVFLNVKGGITKGTIDIPSSLDKVETSILAAAIETVDRIGPCNASVKIKGIEDIRREKMKKIRERASELLQKWNSETIQGSSELAEEVMKAARTTGIITYGQLPAGPEFAESDTIIIVEGRADIAACLRAGVRNTIAVDGAKVPPSIVELTKKKTIIAFLDGDRGGDLILKELLMYGTIDFVARAPHGREVEDLKPDEIIEHLSKKVPIEKLTFITEIHANEILEKAIKRKATKLATSTQKKIIPIKIDNGPLHEKPEVVKANLEHEQKPKVWKPTHPKEPMKSRVGQQHSRSESNGRRTYPPRDKYKESTYQKPQIPEELLPIVKEIENKEKPEGLFLDEKLKILKRVPVEKLYDELLNIKDATKVIFDGIITQRLIDACDKSNINTIIGARTSEIERRPVKLRYYTFA